MCIWILKIQHDLIKKGYNKKTEMSNAKGEKKLKVLQK